MLLFIFLLIYVFFIFFLRSYLLWKKTGINPLTFDNKDDAHGYNGKVFTFISVLELVVVAVYAFLPDYYAYLLPFWYLESTVLCRIGWVLIIASLMIIWTAQSHMRLSWRIGIDETNPIELVTTGAFAYSRNPIFLGIMMANVGLFAIIPNAFMLLIVSLSTVSVNTQIRLEEAFLESRFGVDYLNYKKRVRRWI